MRDMISIITTVYNTRVEYLEDCINSVVNQTYTNHEHIIIDDGSTNKDTVDYLKGLSKKDSRIIVVFQNHNMGIGASRNRGIKEASGDYLCFLDSDDYITYDHLEKLYEPILNDDFYDMVIDEGYKCVDDNSKQINEVSCATTNHEMVSYYSVPTGCRLMRRSIIVEYDIMFPEGRVIYEDNAFCTAVTVESKKRTRICNKGYINRVNIQSYSHSDRYRKLQYKYIPVEYINEKIIKRYRQNVNCYDDEDIIIASCILMYATCMLFFCRESDSGAKIELLKCVSRDIRSIVNKNFIRYIKEWFSGVPNDWRKKWIYYGLFASISIKAEIYYSVAIHRIIKCFQIKKTKNERKRQKGQGFQC